MTVFLFSSQNTIVEWSHLFTIGAVAYIVPALVFILFGSGEVQPWNEPPAKKLDESLPKPASPQVDTNTSGSIA